MDRGVVIENWFLHFNKKKKHEKFEFTTHGFMIIAKIFQYISLRVREKGGGKGEKTERNLKLGST